MEKLRIIIPVFLILVIVIVSFYPCLQNKFTNWDDDLYVTDNKTIQSAGPAKLKNIFTTLFIAHYQPVTVLSYALEYHFFKLDPFYYHLTNLILHLLNCLLVFWLIYLLSNSLLVAALTAVFFGIHPLQAESVAWISERKNLLYAFFYLGAMISYIYYLSRAKKLKYYIFCLSLFILSLLSKSAAVTLPLVLLALDYFYSRKPKPAVLTEKVPFFVLALIFGMIALRASELAGTINIIGSYPALTRLMGICGDIIFYLNKLFLPLKLSALYPYVEIKENPFYPYALITVIIILAGVIASGKYSKKIIFGSGLFLLTIFPALRFLPLPEAITAERYVYLPAVGIFFLLAQGFIWLYQRRPRFHQLIRVCLIILLGAVITFLGCSSWKRSQVWKDSLSLWNDVIKKYPNIAKAYNNRGEVFLVQGEYERARADFEQAIQKGTPVPDNLPYRYYYINLGGSLRSLGRTQEAIEIFELLIRESEEYSSPTNLRRQGAGNQNKTIDANRRLTAAGAYFNLASIQDSGGDKNKAIALYSKAIEFDPRLLQAYDNLGTLYAGLGRKEEAEVNFIKAIEIDSTYTPAYIKLARLYQILNRQTELITLYKKAIDNDLDFFSAYYNIGNFYTDVQKDKEAIRLYRRAVALNPISKEACLGLGNAYLTLGKNKAAIIWLKKALELDPDLAVAHNNLSLAYYYAAEYDLAIKHSDQASQLGYSVSPKLQKFLKPYKRVNF